MPINLFRNYLFLLLISFLFLSTPQQIYPQPESSNELVRATVQFNRYLKAINIKDPNSITLAKIFLTNSFKNDHVSARDAYNMFERYYEIIIDKLNKNLKNRNKIL